MKFICLNGEVISGISLTVFGIMLVIYGLVNEVAAILIPADIMIIAIGVAVIVVGVFTNRKNTVIHSWYTEFSSNFNLSFVNLNDFLSKIG